MKKIFTENKALVYVCLSFLSVIGFAVVFVLRSYLRLWPFTDSLFFWLAMPPLLAGIVFGLLAIMSYRKTPKPMAKIIFATIAILLNSASFFLLLILSVTMKPPIVTIVSEGARKRDVKLDEGVVVGTFCARDLGGVDVFEDTKIYEQYGTWFWQKRRVDMNAIQPGQVVDIKYFSVFDHEFSNNYSLFRWGATQITIRKGEFEPYETGNCPKP